MRRGGRFFLLCLCFLGPVQLALGLGLMPAGPLSTIKTKYFDIIYPKESEKTARYLSIYADGIFLKAMAALDLSVPFRMPVVITPMSQTHNAYFSPFPYNLIVLYDIAPEPNLAVYDDSLLSVFYHEIVHAVSANIRHPFIESLSRFFGNPLAPTVVYNLPTSLTEGMAVVLESGDGWGRLNDGFSLHPLRQAKIEGRFPSYTAAAGARDTYPAGLIPYIFGGAFTSWLIDRYGKDKYIEFVKKNGSFFLVVSVKTFFKQVYGLSIDEAWKAFEDSVRLPELNTDLEASLFDEKTAKSRFPTSLASSRSGIVWSDRYSGNIYRYAANGFQLRKKAERLFSVSGAERVRLSHDGELLILSYIYGESGLSFFPPLGTREYLFYNVEKRRFLKLPVLSFKEAAPLRLRNGSAAAAGLSYEGRVQRICFFSVQEGGVSADDEIGSIAFEAGTEVYSLTDAGGGLLAFVLRRVGESFLCLADPLSLSYKRFPLPKVLRAIRDLSFVSASGDENLLSFSWADTDTLPRLGLVRLNASAAEWKLMADDLSGGVYAPVALDPRIASGGGELVYIAQFYEEAALMRLDGTALAFFSPAASGAETEQGSADPAGMEGDVRLAEKTAPDAGRREAASESDVGSEGLEGAPEAGEGGGPADPVGVEGDGRLAESAAIGEGGELAAPLEAGSADGLAENGAPEVGGRQGLSENGSPEAGGMQGEGDLPGAADTAESIALEGAPEALAYNPFPYLLRGFLLPVGNVPLYTPLFTQAATAFLGFTWLTMDPAQRAFVELSGGFEPASVSGGFSLSLRGGGSRLSYTTQATVLFSQAGWEQSYVKLDLVSAHRTGREGVFTVRNLSDYFAGRVPGRLGRLETVGNSIKLRTELIEHDFRDYGILAFSTIRQRRREAYSYGGFRISAFVLTAFNSRRTAWAMNTGMSLSLALPRLLPFTSPQGLTLNMPIMLTASLFPSASEAMSAEARLTLLSAEMQNALSPLPLYAQRLRIHLSYRGSFSYDSSWWDIVRIAQIYTDREIAPYRDRLMLSVITSLSITQGALTYVQADMGFNLIWKLHYEAGESPLQAGLVFSVGL